jgi:pimeloyl-ACP methyl ester carboxylesterase
MRIKKWLKRIALAILFVIVIALISGIIYEQIGRHQAKYYAESRIGNFIDAGGHDLYYEKKGEGDITVIFESGTPVDHSVWRFISDTISNYATTITYDRAGLLWSDRGANAKTAANVSTELEILLNQVSAAKPYILVGHSAAGIFLRPFITDHHNDIQGVVLIDPSHPQQMDNAPEEIKEFMRPPFFPPKWVVWVANELGLPRLFTGDPLLFRSLKNGGAYDELKYLMYEMNGDSLTTRPNTWSIPLLVISAGNQDSFLGLKDERLNHMMKEYWSNLQLEVSQLSSKGERIVAENSGHNMLYPERELITNEILKMIQIKDSVTIE